jgi:hypothetical protein
MPEILKDHGNKLRGAGTLKTLSKAHGSSFSTNQCLVLSKEAQSKTQTVFARCPGLLFSM